MNNRKLKAIILCLSLVLSLVMSACKSEKRLPLDETGSENVTVTKEPIESEPEGVKLTLAEIEKLAEECVFTVHWYTSTEGDYSAGTAFVMDSDKFGGKILVTAYHYLVPDGEEDSFKGKDLPNYVQGGYLYYAKSGKVTDASLKNCIVIEDAQAVPAVNKDVAAFTLYNSDGLKTLPLSTHSVKIGDKLYLLASLWKGDNINENCVYEGVARMDMQGQLSFQFDKNYDTTGGSGGPIVNEYGEVVAIHMASNMDNSVMYGHSAKSFLDQINAGTVSSVTYEEKHADDVQGSIDGEAEEYFHYADDLSAETFFFNLKITGTEMLDSIGGVAAPEGMKFAVVSMTIDTVGLDAGDFYIFSDDFSIMWDDDYSTGYDETELEGITGEETLIQDNSLNFLKTAFLIPQNPESLVLYFMDYYYDQSDVFHKVADHYFEIPVNGF